MLFPPPTGDAQVVTTKAELNFSPAFTTSNLPRRIPAGSLFSSGFDIAGFVETQKREAANHTG